MNKRQNIPKIQENNSGKADVSYTNSSLVRVTNILICLSNGLNTSTDIANHCNYSISTVHRLLNVMKRLNLTILDSFNHKYYLGPLVSQLTTNQTSAHRYFIINALQEMGHLSEFTQETVSLTILVQYRYIMLHDIPCKQELKITEHLHTTGAVFAPGATGKVLLSQLPDEEMKEVLNTVDLPKVTEKSVTDKRKLMAQLNDIRQQGYAVSSGEKIPGAMCFSAPILNYEFPAALNILGPEIRLKPKAAKIINELKHSASRISNNITGAMLRARDMHHVGGIRLHDGRRRS
jgi:DNA-binding IclR family transcriptional regulator